MEVMKQLQVLIKPASSACNLSCRYCFYEDESNCREIKNYGVMSAEIRKTLIENALSCAEDGCIFAFQGGEPVLAGLEWFQDFVEEVNKRKVEKQQIAYTIQTNGTLLDEKWLTFLKENQFLVGLSLDGTEVLHDENRKDKHGNGTFSKVLSVAEELRKREISFNILTVLTGQSAEKVGEIYDFYKKQGFLYQQYIPCLDALNERQGSNPYSIWPKQYEYALKVLFDRWFQDTVQGEACYIRQFDNWLTVLAGGAPEACSMCGKCSMQNVVEANGDVYPCDFYVLDEYKIGNVTEKSFEEMQRMTENADEVSFFREAEKRDDRCAECRYYPLCRGGCRRDLIREGEKCRQYFCEAYEGFFQYALVRMEWLLGSGDI